MGEPKETSGGTGGEGIAADQAASIDVLLPVVYQELRTIARRERYRLATKDTLATTGLVNEAYLRLARSPEFADRSHFLRIASIAMRRVLVDRVRAQVALKRGGETEIVELDEAQDFVVEDGDTVLAVSDALDRLGKLNPRLAQVVECRFFAGYSEIETAEALGTSERSVQRDWATARAWLKKELG